MCKRHLSDRHKSGNLFKSELDLFWSRIRAKMLDNLTVWGHFSELEHQIVLKFAENLSKGEILAEFEQNFADLEQKFTEFGQNLAPS